MHYKAYELSADFKEVTICNMGCPNITASVSSGRSSTRNVHNAYTLKKIPNSVLHRNKNEHCILCHFEIMVCFDC